MSKLSTARTHLDNAKPTPHRKLEDSFRDLHKAVGDVISYLEQQETEAGKVIQSVKASIAGGLR